MYYYSILYITVRTTGPCISITNIMYQMSAETTRVRGLELLVGVIHDHKKRH